jgi:hypothetical protein
MESLPSYINRMADAHAMTVAMFLSSEIMPALELSGNSPPSNYLAWNSKFLLLGDRLADKVANRLASLTGLPDVARLVHPHFGHSLGWTRDLREFSAWCPEYFASGTRLGNRCISRCYGHSGRFTAVYGMMCRWWTAVRIAISGFRFQPARCGMAPVTAVRRSSRSCRVQGGPPRGRTILHGWLTVWLVGLHR